MSYFGTELTRQMEKSGMNQRELSKVSGVDDSKISRYRSGEQIWIPPDNLLGLAKALSTDRRDQGELIRARLLDELGPASELVRIEIGDQPFREAAPRYEVRLPADLERALATIREHVSKDRDVQTVVLGLGELLGREFNQHFADSLVEEKAKETRKATGAASSAPSSTSDKRGSPSPSVSASGAEKGSGSPTSPGESTSVSHSKGKRTSHTDKPRKKSS